MATLDRLGWAAGVTFTCHGARIGIRATDAALIEQLPPHLPPSWKPASSPVVDTLYSLVGGGGGNGRVKRFDLLYHGAGRLARTLDRHELLTTLESHLHFAVAQAARRRLFVHAGVVGWGGYAIVIPGRSRTGKSTLVAALVNAGATYLSDEYAVFDARGRVHPFRKPLSLRATADTPPRTIAADALGGPEGTGALPVGLVVVTEYRPGSRWRPRRRTPARGILALLANTVLARLRPAFALDILNDVVAEASILVGVRGEAGDTAGRVLQLLDAAPHDHARPIRRGGSHATESAQRPAAGSTGRAGARRVRPVQPPSPSPQSNGHPGLASL